MLESKIGKLFIITYALFSIAVYAVVFFCNDASCIVYIVLPIMPWAYILAGDFGLSFTWAVYPIFVLLNTSVVYVIGASIEWAYNRYLDHKEAGKLIELNRKDITQRNT
jgi:hypothetical protein